MKSIVFAGGCFWGVEAYFKLVEGVSDTEVGYIDGPGEVTYEQVCNASGHAEACLISYDESVVSLKKLLDHLFNIINPTALNKQGNDIGIQYRTGVYNFTEDEYPFIKNYLNIRKNEYSKPLTLELKTNLTFYPAETYHQDYLEKNPNGYCHVNLSAHKNID
jgi:methionine-S-sulfoxide reductase